MRQYRFDVFGKTTLRLFGSDAKLTGKRELSAEQIDQLVDEVEGGYERSSRDVADLGRRLYAWLDGPAEGWLAKARQGTPGLAIHVDVEERLRHLPWELLCEDKVFLCGQADYPFTPVRRVHGVEREDVEEQNRPLRMLFMACSPEGVEPVLHFEDEEQRIVEATAKQPIELVVEELGSLTGLTERTESFGQGYFDVLHLTGHANVVDGVPHFVMEDDYGGPTAVTAQQIVEAMGGLWPRLVFFSGCKTGQAVDAGMLPSLCEAIVRAGAPALLGWALPVGDAAATAAAAELYHHLAVGRRIDEAVARARGKLFKDGMLDWHLLRLYADATDLSEMVTPLQTKGRAKLHVCEAAVEFLDAGAKGEVCPRKLFVGRRRNIQRCLRALRSGQGQAGYHEGVVLYGMGGLGKSSLAARLCERMPQHRRLVWVKAVDEPQLLFVLGEGVSESGAGAVLNEADVPLKHRLSRLLREHLDKEPALFVFDDFEANVEEDDEGQVRVDEQGRALLTPEALDVLRDVLEAIRETASDSRVMVTCRYLFVAPSTKASLHEEALEHFEGADLAKKLVLLPALSPQATTDQTLRERAISLGGGNPRLLGWLNRVVAHAETDVEVILSAMAAETERFREDTLVRVLLAQQSAACRRLLALAAVCRLPVDRLCIEGVAGDLAVDPHLNRAASLGLIEAGLDPQTHEPRYYVPDILEPLLDDELTDAQRTEACRRAARHLYQKWWVEVEGLHVERGLEVHRLALLAGQSDIAVDIADTVATHWINRSRYREAKRLSERTLSLGDDYRILHNLARAEDVLGFATEAREHYERALNTCPELEGDTSEDIVQERGAIMHNMAGLIAQQGDVERAMALWDESLKLDEQIGDVGGKAATLHEMGCVMARQGDVHRAMELWNESLKLKEQIGDVRGKAATLHDMAGVIAQQGDVERAMELWNESLKLKEQIGNVRGKAATLHNMANVIAQQGDVERAMALWNESLKLDEQIGNVGGKAATLDNMAGVMAQQGDVNRAMELWSESLKLLEQIGDAQGKAATLTNMAWAAGEQGDTAGQRELNLEAARALAGTKAWVDLVTVLGNLGVSDEADAPAYLGQALWLTLQVQVPLPDVVNLAAGFLQKVGEKDDASPLMAMYAYFLVEARGKDHPEYEKLRQNSSGMLVACAAARGIEPTAEKIAEWVKSEGPNDPKRFLPALNKALEQIVADDEWVFDRSVFEKA